MRPITFIICASGRGQRFKQHGIKIPKPMIKFNGMTMLEKSVSALKLNASDQLIVIGQKDDKLESHLSHRLSATWIEIEGQTGGQLETFLYAESKIINSDIVIFNCDTYFECQGLRSLIEAGNLDGIIPCSIEPGNAWSFCEVDDEFNIRKVAEKNRISEWASVGYYYFKGRDRLIELAKAEVLSIKSGESYVAPLYNRYLDLNLALKIIPTETFLPFGTLEQLKDYWSISVDELLKENS